MTGYFPEDDEYKGQLDIGLWKRILAHTRPYRGALAGLGISGMVLAGFDSLLPLVTGWLIDEATENGASGRLVGFIVGYASLMFGVAVCVWVFIMLAGRAATGIAYDLRMAGFRRLQELSFSYFDVRPVGWLVSRLTADCTKLSSLIPWFMLDLVWGVCTLAGITLAMFWLSWKLAIVVLAIVPPLALVSVYFQRKLLTSSREVRRTNSQITASFNEAISGVRTTKTLVREEANLGEFQVLSTGMYRHSLRNALQSAVYLPLVITLGSAGVGLALWRGGIVAGGELSLGSLVAFMQYAALFYMPIQELARRFTEVQSAQAAAERVQSLLDTVPEIRDSDVVEAAMAAQREQPKRRPGVAVDGYDERIETIEFRDLSFWYKEDEPVLEGFNLRVEAGQTVALVGATGGGKSTIASLVARFYEPCEGELLINGVDYRQRSLHWLQSNLGVVLQTPHLFSGTIRENIRYGRLDATDDEVVEAARLVNAHDFIVEHEDAYEGEVGEGGARLSTGQRQLVSLARAVLANPQIFIMDEATSSVDTETETLIQDAIDTVLANRIAFVIAHRLSTVRKADTILVIDGGRIVEHGTHDDLLRRRGRYHMLYTRQFAKEREEAVLGGE